MTHAIGSFRALLLSFRSFVFFHILKSSCQASFKYAFLCCITLMKHLCFFEQTNLNQRKYFKNSALLTYVSMACVYWCLKSSMLDEQTHIVSYLTVYDLLCMLYHKCSIHKHITSGKMLSNLPSLLLLQCQFPMIHFIVLDWYVFIYF